MTQSSVVEPKVTVEIRRLQPGEDGTAFRTLNEEWIQKYFILEARDREVLGAPEKILADGGQIYFVYSGAEVVGCVALMAFGDGVFELTKMAVSPEMRGLGIGRKLLTHVLADARTLGASTVFLGSSTTLKNAVHLYESLGFEHVPPESLPWIKYARASVFMRMEL